MRFTKDKGGSKLLFIVIIILFFYLALFRFDFKAAYNYTVQQDESFFQNI